MADINKLVERLYASIGEVCIVAPDVAHIEIHGNQVAGVHSVPGLNVDANRQGEILEVMMHLEAGVKIDRPVRLCFGILDPTGRQRIRMHAALEEDSRVALLGFCTFPNARNIVHEMEADISVGRKARYAYYERHVHGNTGGVKVIPRTQIVLHEDASFHTDFEVIKGRAGTIDLEYEAHCKARSILTMSSRISGRENDRIKIHEKAYLEGDNSRGTLRTTVAAIQHANADILNTLIASAPNARGHVDCKEIIKDQAVVRAVPVVEVRDPQAHVTHEAALGSVDSKQLQTLMARGLSEEAATDLIIEGLLRPAYRPGQ
ncbi:MAG: SufBD protein [Chitinivibrionales bacterium]|nr:SufBD protein [Chitinivibrionales bacterium]